MRLALVAGFIVTSLFLAGCHDHRCTKCGDEMPGDAKAAHDHGAKAKDPAAERKRRVDEYNDTFASPWIAAQLGYLDDVIEPQETRPRLIAALEMLRQKRQSLPFKKHGNPPL